MRKAIILAALGAVCAAAVTPASAQSGQWHNPVAIDRAVAEFTGAVVGAVGGARHAVDRRVRLAACVGPLALDWRNARQDTVLVECPDRSGWRMFVPIMKQSAVQSTGQSVNDEPQVKRGQAVTIAIRGRGFAVSQPGQALEKGRVGDWIKVKPLSGKETLHAKIIDPGRVEVTLR